MRAAVVLAVVLGCAIAAGCQAERFGVTDEAVMGGHDAPPGKWPDVAAVMFGGEQGCTGTLIAPTVVLTAGHCNDLELDSVLIGTHSLAAPGAGETIEVMQRIEYPFSQTQYDVTVLVLRTASTKAPRAIATGWARLDIKNQAPVAIVGYGAIDQDSTTFVNELQEAETTITDAGCTTKPGCNTGAKPNGELGAGGMGIDTCPGDSGGPLYTLTPYGTFLAGVTSRAYDDAVHDCIDGGIYVRPDKIIDWIESKVGAVKRGPEPAAPALAVVRGRTGETQITAHDPIGTAHTYAIAAQPARGTATVDADGVVRVTTGADTALGDDTIKVTVTDAANPARAVELAIRMTVTEPPVEPPPVEEPGGEEPGDDDGGGCAAGGAAGGGTLPGAAAALAALLFAGGGRRRRRRAAP